VLFLASDGARCITGAALPIGPDLDAIVSYDDRLLSAAGDAGLATVSPRDENGPRLKGAT
jgi:hypothetical protein